MRSSQSRRSAVADEVAPSYSRSQHRRGVPQTPRRPTWARQRPLRAGRQGSLRSCSDMSQSRPPTGHIANRTLPNVGSGWRGAQRVVSSLSKRGEPPPYAAVTSTDLRPPTSGSAGSDSDDSAGSPSDGTIYLTSRKMTNNMMRKSMSAEKK